jgi:hypothetical protein
MVDFFVTLQACKYVQHIKIFAPALCTISYSYISIFQRPRSYQRRQYAANMPPIYDKDVLTLVGNSKERVHNQANNHD